MLDALHPSTLSLSVFVSLYLSTSHLPLPLWSGLPPHLPILASRRLPIPGVAFPKKSARALRFLTSNQSASELTETLALLTTIPERHLFNHRPFPYSLALPIWTTTKTSSSSSSSSSSVQAASSHPDRSSSVLSPSAVVDGPEPCIVSGVILQ